MIVYPVCSLCVMYRVGRALVECKRLIRTSVPALGLLALFTVTSKAYSEHSADQLYVLNRLGGTVSVVNTGTDKVVQTIDLPYPRGAAFSPDGKTVYISSEDEHTVISIDRKTGTKIRSVKLTGHPAGNLQITKDGKHILVGLTPFLDLAIKHKDPKDSGGEDIVDTSTMTVIKTIHIPEGVHDTFLSPDGKYAILGSDEGTFADIVDISKFEIVGKIPFDRSVLTLAIEGAGPGGATSRVFVELKNLNGFAVVDFPDRKEVARIMFPDAVSFQFAGGFRPDGTVQFNPTHGTALSPDGKHLWVTSRATNTAYVYSTADLKLVKKIHMPEIHIDGKPAQGSDPHWDVFTHDGKKIYICLAQANEVIALDTHSYREVARFSVGTRPTVMEMAPRR